MTDNNDYSFNYGTLLEKIDAGDSVAAKKLFNNFTITNIGKQGLDDKKEYKIKTNTKKKEKLTQQDLYSEIQESFKTMDTIAAAPGKGGSMLFENLKKTLIPKIEAFKSTFKDVILSVDKASIMDHQKQILAARNEELKKLFEQKENKGRSI